MLAGAIQWTGLNASGESLLCALVAAALIALLYRYERRLVSARQGLVLLALRWLVVVVVFLALLEPVWNRQRTDERHGRIVLALDLSESMSATDPQASPAEKLRWARSLGMIGSRDSAARLDRWLADLEAGREPDWVTSDESGDPERSARLAAHRREHFDSVIAQLDQLSRREIARRLLTGGAASLLVELQKLGQVDVQIFAGNHEPIALAQLADALSTPPASVDAGRTDLRRGMTPVGGSGEQPLLGVILMSDGRDNVPGSFATANLPLESAAPAPVYAVVLGSTVQPRDLAIRRLDFPPTVLKDDRALLKVTVNTTGFAGQSIEVFLERVGTDPQVRRVTPSGDETHIDFELDAAKLGRHEYTLRIPPLPGEARDSNNASAFAVSVVDDKPRVLVLDGEARWEFRFIDNAYRRDARISLQEVVFEQPTLGLLPENFFRNNLGWPARPDDLRSSPFAEQDLVIIGDVAPGQLPSIAWSLLEKYVSEAGGTLVLCAGKNHFPHAFHVPLLDQLLPVTELRPITLPKNTARDAGSPGERGFHLQLTPSGVQEAMLQFTVDSVENRRIWQQLPGHTWALLGTAKPGAQVLLVAESPAGEASLEAERQRGILIRQQYGRGQVLWLGIDSTWRWRHRVGDRYHHRFWGQLARDAAGHRAAAGNEQVRFGPERSDITEGEDVLLRARWAPLVLDRFPGLTAAAEVFRAGDPAQPVATIPLSPPDGRPQSYEGRAAGLAPGEYQVRLTVSAAALKLPEIAAPLVVHPRPRLELNDVSANVPLMQQIATASGGQLLTADQVGQIPELIRARSLTATQTEDQSLRLWDHWLLLVVVISLLAAEWTLRKWNGLP